MEASKKLRDETPNALFRVLSGIQDSLQRNMFARRAGRTTHTDGRDRDMWEILGYPDDIRLDDYYARYIRSDIAGTIVDAPPRTTWRRTPSITDQPDSADQTSSRFVQEWERFADRLQVWKTLERLDRLAGVGHYATMLIGTGADIRGLGSPVRNVNDSDDVLFLSVYRQDHSEVDVVVEDPSDPRFGLPELYDVTIFGDRERGDRSRSSGTRPRLISGLSDTGQVKVHWSHMIHVAEDLLEDEINGRPRLERVWNLLTDLMKIAGGSAEMFWANVAGVLHVNIPGEVEIDEESLEDLDDQIQEMLMGLRRDLLTRSAEAEYLGAGTPDPRGVFEVLSSLISATTGIPQRILFGAEAGELASSLDEANWLARIRERQLRYAEPVILRPLVDRLIDMGALPAPQGGEYEIHWPSLFEISDKDEAEIMATRARAYRDVAVASSVSRENPIMSPEEARESILALPRDLPSGLEPMPPAGNESPEAGGTGPAAVAPAGDTPASGTEQLAPSRQE